MAPVFNSRSTPNFTFGRPSHAQPFLAPDVIEIDDEDDGEHADQTGDTGDSVDEMDEDETDGANGNDDDESIEEEESEIDNNDIDDIDGEDPEKEEALTVESLGKVNGIGSGDIFNTRTLMGSPAIRHQSSMFTSSGFQEALHPLRNTADRVTRQMQAFAEKLDRFRQKGQSPPHVVAYSLIKSYQQHASDAIKDASRQSTLQKAKSGWSSNRAVDQPDAKYQEDLRRLQLEVDTWDIFLTFLKEDSPQAKQELENAQKSVFQVLHRYSTDKEIWDKFIAADEYASECSLVIQWLETKAKASSQHWDAMIAKLESQADRGSGLWAHGWLYTKESIKGQKRLRQLPQPLDPGDPGILASLLNPENREPLITQLDPDAVIRQKHALQKQDQFYEEATWVTAWKMIRQGEPWSKIQAWSQERLESWRAVSLCGSRVESVNKKPADSGLTRMMNCRSQDTWRAACSALARNPSTSDYERAVYALLSGETEPAYQVCQSWDDHLYVFYNSILLNRYRKFCSQLSRKLSHSPLATITFVPEPLDYSAIRKFFGGLRTHEVIGMEARNPYVTIQTAILGRDFNSFFISTAKAAAEINKASSSLIPDMGITGADRSALIAMQDKDAVRIITHMYTLLRQMKRIRLDESYELTAALNVISYAEHLLKADLADWIPLYLSYIPIRMVPDVLVHVLMKVVKPQERTRMIRLLNKHGFNDKPVHEAISKWVLDHAPTANKCTVSMTHQIRRDSVKGVVILLPVSKKFGAGKLSDEIEQVINCVEWLVCLQARWTGICTALEILYKRFYGKGMFSEARALSERLSLTEISQKVLGWDVRSTITPEELSMAHDPSALRSPPKSPSKSSRFRRMESEDEQHLRYQESVVLGDLEHVTWAYIALEEFQLVWEKLELAKNPASPDHAHMGQLSVELQARIETATEEIEAFIDKDWGVLDKRIETDDWDSLEWIKNTYFPDIILNYLSALYYASLKLDRRLLTRSMELAVALAEDNNMLECFYRSRRMRELADAMALTSIAMLNAPMEAKIRKKADGPARLDIWNIEVENNGNEESA